MRLAVPPLARMEDEPREPSSLRQEQGSGKRRRPRCEGPWL